MMGNSEKIFSSLSSREVLIVFAIEYPTNKGDQTVEP